MDLFADDSEHGNATIVIDAVQNKAVGHRRIPLERPSDIFALIQQILSRRTSRGTSMNSRKTMGDNENNIEHAGSSRSHCALIFTILHSDKNDNGGTTVKKLRQTCFHVVDLAGAERPSKIEACEDSQGSAFSWYFKTMKGEPITCEEEGLLINYGLSEFSREVKVATNLHKRKKAYQVPRQGAMPLTQYLGRCIDGRAMTNMIVCLSQAPQCGWETWFSLNYGTDLAELRTLVKDAKTYSLDKALGGCERAQKQAIATLAEYKRKHANSDTPNTKRWLEQKRIDVLETTERLKLISLFATDATQ
jgi:hypothetical protein